MGGGSRPGATRPGSLGGRGYGDGRPPLPDVLEWSRAQRPHGPRESLFIALAGSPGAAAERGLAEIEAAS